ncbi:hypothetical protein DTW90_20145 [Neorhizobium sp. P12A]|uniref:hypothetical protein n=1 Tax=Neorhizobium sp. P12A TaxID=2268027 RepID=UPI0011EF2B47|nr:hypothetical protein [Neorhizobium sp. P12A]KAA0697689.1 hypothetical protein DTW90_20145 [Neorhizobium sp. P12A]
MATPQEERIERYLFNGAKPRNEWEDWVLERWRAEPVRFSLLERRVAELMAIPQLRCYTRSCRRNGRCRFIQERDDSPFCLRNLTEAENEAYGQLLHRAMRSRFDPGPADGKTWRELDLARLEVELAMSSTDRETIRHLRGLWRRIGGARERK